MVVVLIWLWETIIRIIRFKKCSKFHSKTIKILCKLPFLLRLIQDSWIKEFIFRIFSWFFLVYFVHNLFCLIFTYVFLVNFCISFWVVEVPVNFSPNKIDTVSFHQDHHQIQSFLRRKTYHNHRSLNFCRRWVKKMRQKPLHPQIR